MSEEMKEYKLTLKEISKVGEDYYIFDFDKPTDFTFKEGQYGVFKLIDKEVEGRKFRAFSIASANDENYVRIATKIIAEPSDFKAHMRAMKPGDQIKFTGFMGNFTLEEDHPSIFISGGIGITPIRSVLKSFGHKEYENDSVLVYSEPRRIYPFANEFEDIKVDKHYASEVDETKKYITRSALRFENEGYYYIAGSNFFVNAVNEQLQSLGIESSRIKYDRFTGY